MSLYSAAVVDAAPPAAWCSSSECLSECPLESDCRSKYVDRDRNFLRSVEMAASLLEGKTISKGVEYACMVIKKTTRCIQVSVRWNIWILTLKKDGIAKK